METTGTSGGYCYCSSDKSEPHMIVCNLCKKKFHRRCLKAGFPSNIVGDVYFKFVCANCSRNGEESLERMKLQWTIVTMLALFNLRLQNSGKHGFFRWREEICRFIDRNWTILFGADRQKAATWPHTVAGVLSANCNRYFISGADVLGEKGWWALKQASLPTVDELDRMMNNKGSKKNKQLVESSLILEGTRQRQYNVLEAAQALKAKRTMIEGHERSPRQKKMKRDERIELKITLSKESDDSLFDSSPLSTMASTSFYKPQDRFPSMASSLVQEQDSKQDIVTDWLRQDECDNIELDIDIDSSSDFVLPDRSVDYFLNDYWDKIERDREKQEVLEKVTVKQEPVSDEESLDTSADTDFSQATTDHATVMQHCDTGRKRKAVIKEECPTMEAEDTPAEASQPRYLPMTIYEEHQLLNQIKAALQTAKHNPQLKNLYRKLVVRKIKREKGIPLFDLDTSFRTACGQDPFESNIPEVPSTTGRKDILDRYQTSFHEVRPTLHQRMSFFSRLMGLEDDKLESTVSPYTMRVLKPFIYRDYATVPLKLKLLREIHAHHSKNPNFEPQVYPIDYCYVRPQHIPAVNALCNEFFWPGIDMSETLQYPDFSCIALYRKIVIGFAFMVPDVKYDEAYISFIFCHPDWRGAGIASFMLYHLIQTCMGKDITLHVSATSPAVFLYQKFCFKVEEFIHDFYDKYLPVSSKECRHAVFMRLNR